MPEDDNDPVEYRGAGRWYLITIGIILLLGLVILFGWTYF